MLTQSETIRWSVVELRAAHDALCAQLKKLGEEGRKHDDPEVRALSDMLAPISGALGAKEMQTVMGAELEACREAGMSASEALVFLNID